MYTNEQQWDDDEQIAKMLGKYQTEIEDERARQEAYEAKKNKAAE